MDKVNYNPTTWVDRTSVTQGSIIDANSMNNIEKGIVDVTRAINTLITNPPVVGGDGTIVQKGEDGLSAFQLAQQEGFEGTLEEWLESLKGDKGDTGEQGERGETGPQGPQGEPGRDGVSPDITGFKEEISNKCIAIEQKVNDHIENSSNEGSGIKRTDMVDYMGVQHDNIKDANDSNVEYILRKVNTQKYEGSSITANNTYAKKVNSVLIKGVTKFKDLDNGDILDNIDENRNLGLIAGKTNEIETLSTLNLLCIEEMLEGVVIDTAKFKCRSSKFIDVTPGETLWFNMNGEKIYTTAVFYNKNKLEIERVFVAGWTLEKSYFDKCSHIVPENTVFMKILIREGRESQMMCNRGDDYLPYEKGRPYKSSKLSLTLEEPLYSLKDIYDYVDLVSSIYVKNIGVREYNIGDENNNEVVTDKKQTIYKLEKPLVTQIDLHGQKVYSYDGITHYICHPSDDYTTPTLSIEAPTDLSSLVSDQQEELMILKQENVSMKKNESILVARTWDLDFSLNEVEWKIGEILNGTDTRNNTEFLRGTLSNVSLSKYEQAKILINSGVFIKENLIQQLTVYLNRNHLTQEEYNELISLITPE